MTPHRWTDVPIGQDRRNVRLSYLKANAFELMFAVAAAVAGSSTLINPSINGDQAIGAVLGFAGLIWAALYLIGGMLIVFGLIKPSVRCEVAGLILLALGILANAAAIVGERGWVGLTTAVFYVGWAVAAYIRARLVLRIARIPR